jgi:hypothetical protein
MKSCNKRIVRHEYDQSEAVPTNHTEPRRSKRDGKGQWHSKRRDEFEGQAEQFQKEEQQREGLCAYLRYQDQCRVLYALRYDGKYFFCQVCASWRDRAAV